MDCTKIRNTMSAVVATSNSNKQTSSTAASSASTSATEKPGIPTLLGVAVEDGAITNDVSGNTMTLSTSLNEMLNLVTKPMQSQYKSILAQTGFSTSFNITSANSSMPLQNATRRQISQWQAKYTFKDVSERSNNAEKAYDNTLRYAAQQLANLQSQNTSFLINLRTVLKKSESSDSSALATAIASVKSSMKSQGQTGTSATLSDNQIQAIAAQFLQSLEKDADYQQALQSALNDKQTAAIIKSYSTALQAYILADKQFEIELTDFQKGFNGALTFGEQYPTVSSATTTSTATTPTQATPPVYLVSGLDLTYQPHTSTSPGLPTVTANFSGSIYPNPLATLNEQTFRGGAAALSAEWKLGKGPFIKDPADKDQMTVSLSGNYTRLQENQHQAGKKADIALGNLKLEIPISSGVSFPLSMTVANAAQQIKETYVRGSFGISFDLDKLSALLQAKQ